MAKPTHTVIMGEDGKFYAKVGGNMIGPMDTSAEAWRALDRHVGDPISPAESRSDYAFTKSMDPK